MLYDQRRAIGLSASDRIINKIFGRYFYQLESHYPDKNPRDSKEPMYVRFSSLNACGTKAISGPGMPEKQSSYDDAIKRNNDHGIHSNWQLGQI